MAEGNIPNTNIFVTSAGVTDITTAANSSTNVEIPCIKSGYICYPIGAYIYRSGGSWHINIKAMYNNKLILDVVNETNSSVTNTVTGTFLCIPTN